MKHKLILSFLFALISLISKGQTDTDNPDYLPGSTSHVPGTHKSFAVGDGNDDDTLAVHGFIICDSNATFKDSLQATGLPGSGTVLGIDASGYIYKTTAGSLSDTSHWTLTGLRLYPKNINWNVGAGTITPNFKLQAEGSDSVFRAMMNDTLGILVSKNLLGSGNPGSIITDGKRIYGIFNITGNPQFGGYNLITGVSILESPTSITINQAYDLPPSAPSLGQVVYAPTTSTTSFVDGLIYTSSNLARSGLTQSGSSNIAITNGSPRWTGNSNIALGDGAGADYLRGEGIFIGVNAGNKIDSAITANLGISMFGTYAGSNWETGSDITLMGHNAALIWHTGNLNTLYGQFVGGSQFSGNANSYFGCDIVSNGDSCTGDNNTAMGYGALYNLGGASNNNTAIGVYAGGTMTSGSGNILIGYYAGQSDATLNNRLIIANSAGSYFVDGHMDADSLVINGDLRVRNILQLPTGASAGYVLQSDAVGNASWASDNNADYANLFSNGTSYTISQKNRLYKMSWPYTGVYSVSASNATNGDITIGSTSVYNVSISGDLKSTDNSVKKEIYVYELQDTLLVTAVSDTNPLKIIVPGNAYGISTYLAIKNVGGMTEINDIVLYVGAVSGDTLTLYENGSAVNAGSYGTYTTGGQVQSVSFLCGTTNYCTTINNVEAVSKQILKSLTSGRHIETYMRDISTSASSLDMTTTGMSLQIIKIN